MQVEIKNVEEFEAFKKNNLGAVLYFSTPDCNVCKVLKPKLIKMLEDEFPEMKFGYVNVEIIKELSAQMMIFAVPTILFYFEGKEFLRKSRNVNLESLREELGRIYSIIFG